MGRGNGGYFGNARWKGVRLKDVLKHHFHDTTPWLEMKGIDGYYNAIPVSKLHDDCILAFEMNGEVKFTKFVEQLIYLRTYHEIMAFL